MLQIIFILRPDKNTRIYNSVTFFSMMLYYTISCYVNVFHLDDVPFGQRGLASSTPAAKPPLIPPGKLGLV